MAPLLSIIIPHYNHNDGLRSALANIIEQTIKDFEVVVVDDFSDISCKDIVEEYEDKGIHIVFIQNKRREYTKNSRIKGIEASNGHLITFIDADDMFYGTKALAYHVEKQIETNADMLQFALCIYRFGKILTPKESSWGQPLAEGIVQETLFQRYVRSGFGGHTVCGKIATRELWEQCLPVAKASSVRRYAEDFFLSTLLFFHARRYFGSNRIGYVYDWIDKYEEKSFGRAMTYYAMLTECLPYLDRQGADPLSSRRLRDHLLREIRRYVDVFLCSRGKKYSYPRQDLLFEEMQQHGDAELILKVLMTGLLKD